MKHILLLFCLMAVLPASAQSLLKRPLQFVPADSVFVLPRGDHNIIMDIMAVAPFIGPKPIEVTADDKRAFKQQGDDVLQGLSLTQRTSQSAKLLLLTGQSRYVEQVESSYFGSLPAALADDGILPRSERIAAAQELLNLTGTIIATDGKRDIYVNFFENCVTRIKTKKVRLLLDMISEYPDGPMVKLRIDGLDEANVRFALHIRVPDKGAPNKYYLDGHEIIRPIVSDGYLVIDRTWRNGEEIYFILNPS